MTRDAQYRPDATLSAEEILADLRAAMMDAEPGTPSAGDDASALIQWIKDLRRSSSPDMTALSVDSMSFIAELTPEASLTQHMVSRLERARKEDRDRISLESQASNLPAAMTPASFLRDLRVGAGIDEVQAANAWGIPVERLVAVEQGQAPWHELPPQRIAAAASALQKPATWLLVFLRTAARQLLLQQVRGRLTVALSRHDFGVNAENPELDTLRFALAAVEESNRAAATFFRHAEAAMPRDAT